VARQPHDRAAALWRRLAPERWPVPPACLPAGTALVGGAVRDALLGRLATKPDLDLVVPGDAVALSRRLAGQLGGAVVVLDRERSIARLVLRGWTVDLARQLGDTLEQDLLRRDYSANALALALPGGSSPDDLQDCAGGLQDPSGGMQDLAEGRLRAIREANLLADPLRLLRGVRLAWELNLTLEPTTEGWIQRHHGRLQEVAGERILAELERLAASPGGGAGLAQAVALGLLAPAGDSGSIRTRLESLAPERARAMGLREEEARWALPLARLASVLGPADLERLRASRRLRQSCERLARWHERLESVAGHPDRLPEGERFVLQQQLEADLPALALLADGDWGPGALKRWRNPDDPLFHPRPPLDGATLQVRLGLPPGPRLGALLEYLSRERAFGRLAATADGQTLTLARRWLNETAEPRHG